MIIAILQARMNSTRLPGKMNIPIIQNKGALELMVERVRRALSLDQVVIATTTEPLDDVIGEMAQKLGVYCFRGHPTDVLDRYYQCALTIPDISTIVRLTGDCPLHDPKVIDEVVAGYEKSGKDYFSNTQPPTFPDGLDVEVFSFNCLKRAWKLASTPKEREHVTYYIYQHPQEFSRGNFENSQNLSHLRWTLDEPRDLEFIRAVFKELYFQNPQFHMSDVLELLRSHPQLSLINSNIERNEGLKKSGS